MQNIVSIPFIEANEIFDFNRLNQLPKIIVPKPPNSITLSFAQKHKNHDYIYLMIGCKIGFCSLCNKYISSDPGNVSKHVKAKHYTSQLWKKDFDKIINFFAVNAIPHSIIESKSFAELFPYSLPSLETFETRFHETYLMIQSKIRRILDQCPYYSLSLDEWTRYNYNFIGISVTIESGYYLLCLTVPDDISRTSNVISRILNENLANYNLDRNKIACTCTDCASSVRKAIKISGIEWTPCCSHIINRAFLDWISNDLTLKQIINKLSVLYNNCQFKQYLTLKGKKCKIIPSFIEIRWLSLYNSIKRACQLRKEISEFYSIKDRSIELLEIKDDDKLNDNDWIYLNAILPYITKISNITKKLESDSNDIFFCALDLVMEIYQEITQEMHMSGFIQQSNNLKNGLFTRLIKYEEFLNNLTIAAILNPCLDGKKLLPDELKKYYIEAKNYLKSKIPHQINQNNINTSPRSRNATQNSNEYKLFKKVRIPDNTNIVSFWKGSSKQFPNLFKIAGKYFCFKASSANIERAFSMARYALPDQCGALSKESATERAFLYVNADLLS